MPTNKGMFYLMDRWSDEYEETKVTSPTLCIAFEYNEDEEEFSFYIRSVHHCPITPTLTKRQSRAVFHLVKGISRKTSMMGWVRNITWQDIQSKSPSTYQTLSVKKNLTTIFNEYFTSKISSKELKTSMLRIQICDVDRYDRNVVIAEMDYWIDTHIISQFTEFEIPFPPFTPDIGEIELNMIYLPTSERLIIHYCTLTNLKLKKECEKIYIRASLFLNNKLIEIHKTDLKEMNEAATTDDGLYFTKKLVFDMKRNEVIDAQLLIHVVQIVHNCKFVIGNLVLSYDNSEHWRQILESQRVPITQIHRLSPSAG